MPTPLPPSLDIPTLAAWLHDVGLGTEADYDVRPSTRQARAVRALLEAKVRDGIDAYIDALPSDYAPLPDDESIVSRVLGAAK